MLRCETCGCQIAAPRKKFCKACAQPWHPPALRGRLMEIDAEQTAMAIQDARRGRSGEDLDEPIEE